jgi:hypothetical protein
MGSPTSDRQDHKKHRIEKYFEEGAVQLCLWLLPFVFAATAIGADSIAGSWINENPSTGGVTRLVVRSEDQQLFVRALGRVSSS